MSKQFSDETNNRIAESIYEGRIIGAIKIYREATGCSLIEAKNFIEALSIELRQKFPEKFSAKQGPGCSSAVLLICIFVNMII